MTQYKISSTESPTDISIITVSNSYEPQSAQDHPCLLDGKDHCFHPVDIYNKCCKCGMSYERPADKDFHLEIQDR